MTQENSHEVALQDAWLRRVSKGLVSDSDAAEDLVQDAWVASLESSRRGIDARPWLGGVLRNQVFSFFRSNARRRDREREANGPSESLPPDEIAEQLQMRERVARELSALDEPFRSALYLRFVEGLSVRATSRQLGIAVSTAHAHIQKGLAQLRGRLDRAYGGDRRAWVMAVLPWARTGAPLATLSVATSIMLALTAAVGAALFLASVFPSGSASAGAEPMLAVGSVPLAPPSTNAVPPLAASAARSPVAALPSATTQPPAAAARTKGTTVRGRLLLPGGGPAAGAVWTLSGFASSHQRTMDHGVPSDWTDLTGVSGADGSFELTFASPKAFSYSLVIEHPDWVSASWRWASIETHETKDVGEVTLRAPGGVQGTVVDAQGTPLTARRWQVYAREADVPPHLGLQGAGMSGPADPGTARFALDRLPEGPVNLRIYNRQFGWVEGPRVEVVAGETATVDVPLLEMEAFANAVVFSFRMLPFHSFADPEASHIWLVAPDGTRRHATTMIGSSSGLVFPDVGPGVFRVEVDDPRLEPWSQENVEAGAHVIAELRGNAALAFDIQGPAGATINTFSVDITIENAAWSPSQFRAVRGDQPLVGGRLEGLHPGDYTVTVRSERGSRTTRVIGLQAGETRPVNMTLTAASMLTGRVVRPNGDPAVGVLVRTVTPAAMDDSSSSVILDGQSSTTESDGARRQVDRGFTDENGAFALALSEAPIHIVVAGLFPGPQVESEALDANTATGAPVLMALAAGARINGTLDVPAGLNTRGWMVLFVRTQIQGEALSDAVVFGWVEQDGAFSLGPLEEGPGTLVLLQGGGNGVSPGVIPPNGRALGGLVVLEGETHTPHYEYPGEAPVAVTVSLAGFGQAGPGGVVKAVLAHRALGLATSRSTATASLGPLQLEPGVYDATFTGEDWLTRVSGLEVTADGPAELQVPLGLAQRDVCFRKEDTPLAGASLRFGSLPIGTDGPSVLTGIDGVATLRLGPGRYTMHTQSQDPERVFLNATFDWPLPAGIDVIEFE